MARPESGALMQIGEVADRVGLSLRTIRHYEEVGLVVPATRSKGGFRLYAGDAVRRLLLIKQMKPLGFTLEEMADLLSVLDRAQASPPAAEAADLRERLATYAAVVQARRAELEEQLRAADRLSGSLSDAVQGLAC